MIRNSMRLMIVCAVGACAVAPSGAHDETKGETMDEISSPSPEAMALPAPAALSGDHDVIGNLETLSGCMAPTTCPDPKSCGTWSTSFECDETCLSSLCEGGAEGRLGRGFSNSFRDCTEQDMTTCREWQQTTFTFCGC